METVGLASSKSHCEPMLCKNSVSLNPLHPAGSSSLEKSLINTASLRDDFYSKTWKSLSVDQDKEWGWKEKRGVEQIWKKEMDFGRCFRKWTLRYLVKHDTTEIRSVWQSGELSLKELPTENPYKLFQDFEWLPRVLSAQSRQILCDPGLSPPASSVHVISQAGALQWVTISSSRGSPWPRDQTHCISCVSCIGRQILYHCTTWEVPRNPLEDFKCGSNVIILTFVFVFRVFKILCGDNHHADCYKWLFSWEIIREEKSWIWREEYKVSHIVNILLIPSFISWGNHPIPILNLNGMYEANAILPSLELDTQFYLLITVLTIEWITCLYVTNKEHRPVLS